MKNKQHGSAEISPKVVLTQDEVAQRQAYLEITQTDVALLRQIHKKLESDRYVFAESFYKHLLQFPQLRLLLRDEGTVDRLKHVQSAYFSSLTAGDYGPEYVENRLQIGVVHQRIGLEPQWYIGAYRKYLSELMPTVWRLLHDDPQRFLSTFDALLKIVCLDMSFALDTYIHAERQEVVQLRNYSEQIISSTPGGVMVIDMQRRISTMNRAIKQMFGLGDDKTPVRMPVAGVVPSKALMEAIEEGLTTPGYLRHLVVELPEVEQAMHLQCTVKRTVLDGEQVLLLIAEDITVAMQMRDELHESEERFRVAFHHAAVGLAQVGADGRWLRVNQKLQEIVGYSERELLGMTFQEITHPQDIEGNRQALRRMLAGECADYACEKRYLRKNGGEIWVKVTIAPMRDRHGRTSFISVIEDISRRKQAEEELLHLASHDPLTGLPNRTLLLDRLSQALAHADRARKHVAILFIDLDRFKNINDSLGHDAGDDVIVEASHRLAASVRSADTVARLGGDEFVIVLTALSREEEAAKVAQKILDALLQPMMSLGQELSLSGSIGISVFPKDGKDRQTLLKNADAAMYRAKYAGRNNFQFYTQEMNARTLDRLKLEIGLRHALEREEFVLHYQPQIDMASGEIVGMEVLLRWQPSGMPMVMPDEFIPVAEETGLIVPIGEWALRTACTQQLAWCALGWADIRVAVNLSARQFRQRQLEEMVSRVLHETGCRADRLELEITETVIMENPEAAADTLQKLSDMGVHLAIDDFGTGYSSLSYLKRFPIHSLKIDRSFVHDINHDADDAAIAKSVIALAHSMKLTVTAEGVETAEQLKFLRQQRCDRMQGYYFSRPVPADQTEALLSGHGAADRTM